MPDNHADIISLNKKIETAIAEGQQAIGREKEIRERLDRDYGIKDPADIPKVLKRLEDERKQLQQRVDSGLNRLREKYGW